MLSRQVRSISVNESLTELNVKHTDSTAGMALDQEAQFLLLQLTLQQLSGRAGIKPCLFWLDSGAGKGCRLRLSGSDIGSHEE